MATDTKNQSNETQIAQKQFAHVERYNLITGLFQIFRGKRKAGPVEIQMDLPNGGSLEIIAAKALHVFDAVLLCIIVCKCAQNKKIIYPYTSSEMGKKLRSGLDLLEDAIEEKCLAYETSMRQLIADMNLLWQGTKSVKQIEESLIRSAMVGFVLRTKKDGKPKTYIFHLMSYAKLEKQKETIVIGLNPLLANALIVPGHYAKIDIDSLRELEQAEQLMFIYLSNAIDPGRTRSFTDHELRSYLYGPNTDTLPKNTLSQQKKRAKTTAISLIKKLNGWKYEEKDNLLWIARPIWDTPHKTATKKPRKKRIEP